MSQIVLSAALLGTGLTVDREAGVIYGVKVLTAGVTKPSSFDKPPFVIDAITLSQVRTSINADAVGLKVRVTHPEAKDGSKIPVAVDDLPYRVAFIRNASLNGDGVFADVHFHCPTDPQAIRLMDIAEKAPTSCGLSIVSPTGGFSFERDAMGQDLFRVQQLTAVDWVGNPAGNPGGMLSADLNTSTSKEDITMNESQKDFLRQIGLPWDATEEQTAAFIEALGDEQKAQFAALKEKSEASAAVDAAAAAAEAEGSGGTETETPSSVTEEPPVAAAEEDDEKKKTPVAASASTPTPQATPNDDRVHGIMLACETGGLTVAQAHAYIQDPSATPAKVLQDLRTKKANERNPVAMSVSVGNDLNLETLGVAIQDAIALRAQIPIHQYEIDGGVALSADGRPVDRKPHERANQFRGLTVIDMFRKYCTALGVQNMDSMLRPQIASIMLSRGKTSRLLMTGSGGVALAHSTSDFKGLLADVLGKRLRGAYPLAKKTWPAFCRRTTAPDFKDIKALQIGGAANLEEIPEGEEYTYGTIGESKEVYALGTYGKGFIWTRQMAVNDDLRAFDRLPDKHLQSASRLEERTVYNILTVNPTMADGYQLFSSAHKNLISGVPSVESFGQAQATLALQTELGTTDPLELSLQSIIVPHAIRTKAEQLVNSPVDPSKANQTPNPFQSQQVIPSARLDANSTAQWYFAAPTSEIDTIEVAFLEGEEAPVIEEESDFDTDGLKMKVRHTMAAKAIDFRGLGRSSGA